TFTEKKSRLPTAKLSKISRKPEDKKLWPYVGVLIFRYPSPSEMPSSATDGQLFFSPGTRIFSHLINNSLK
ncbi:MAG: hypothetical protein JAZ03_02725, partial [Candidatus Thiodiazotropha taylori]|nr:hypothetical protein [Candidatus Thiodiazotropha taylori]MCW4332838.1 hypothetical protein [Candidatus Thiodiazotropha endolucinida]